MTAKRQKLKQSLLVLRAQGGDRDALDELLRSLQEPLYRFVLGLTGDRAMAEDVLQDVFVSLCGNLRFLREPQFVKAWAFRIASRRALKVAVRERGLRGLSLEDSGLGEESLAAEPPEPSPYDPELIARLPALLDAISPASRLVLSLHYLEEMSLREAADILQIPVGTAKSRLAYGLSSIRKILLERNRSQGP